MKSWASEQPRRELHLPLKCTCCDLNMSLAHSFHANLSCLTIIQVLKAYEEGANFTHVGVFSYFHFYSFPIFHHFLFWTDYFVWCYFFYIFHGERLFQTKAGFQVEGLKGRTDIFHMLLTLRLNASVRREIANTQDSRQRGLKASVWFVNWLLGGAREQGN